MDRRGAVEERREIGSARLWRHIASRPLEPPCPRGSIAMTRRDLPKYSTCLRQTSAVMPHPAINRMAVSRRVRFRRRI